MGVVAYLVGDKVTRVERGWTKRERFGVNLRLFGLIFSLVMVAFLHSKYIPSFIESGDIVFYSVAVF